MADFYEPNILSHLAVALAILGIRLASGGKGTCTGVGVVPRTYIVWELEM